MRIQMLVLMFGALTVASCAPGKHPTKDWQSVNIHRIIVVCVQNEVYANQRIEAEAEPMLRRQGFLVIGRRDLFPKPLKHSSQDILERLRHERIDGIMEAEEVGNSRQIRLKYHPVKGLAADSSIRFDSLDAVFASLLR